MTGYVLRRSLVSLVGLTALLIGAGFVVVLKFGGPLWLPGVLGIGLVALQYAINPWLIEWMVPASIIPDDGAGYHTDHVVGRIVAHRCAQAGVPLVKLGIVDDGTPNAFTFGHHQGDARIWVTRGLLERLDDRELDAVLSHEIGHIRNRDFIVMTVAAVVPMALYLVYVMARTQRNQGAAIAAAAYVGYVLSQFTLLALSRAREYGADRYSCEATCDGDALASALLKVAYGIGQADAERAEAAARLKAQGGRYRAQRPNRVMSMRAMGIFEPRQAEAVMVAFGNEGDAQRALSGLRWDTVNPWGRTLEKLGSHPLVARRILALADSGLPGAPRQVDVRAALAGVDPATAAQLQSAFLRDLAVGYGPWVLLATMVGFGFLAQSMLTVGLGLLVAGVLLVIKQGLRYPNEHTPAQLGDLLHRLDAGPVQGVGVQVRGRLIGRGFPGYLFSPDLVVQDETGFVPVLYRQPIPFARFLFAIGKAKSLIGQEVVVSGWYRRMPGPAIELESMTARSGVRVRAWMWAACLTASAVLAGSGLVVAALAVFA